MDFQPRIKINVIINDVIAEYIRKLPKNILCLCVMCSPECNKKNIWNQLKKRMLWKFVINVWLNHFKTGILLWLCIFNKGRDLTIILTAFVLNQVPRYLTKVIRPNDVSNTLKVNIRIIFFMTVVERQANRRFTNHVIGQHVQTCIPHLWVLVGTLSVSWTTPLSSPALTRTLHFHYVDGTRLSGCRYETA